MVQMLPKIFELTAFLIIAIIAAIAGIYAIIVNFLSRLANRTKEELDSRIKEAQIYAEKSKEALKNKLSSTSQSENGPEMIKPIAERLLEDLNKIRSIQDERASKIKKLSFDSLFGKPALLSIISFFLIMLALVSYGSLKSDLAKLILSMICYLGSLIFLAICLFSYVIPHLKEINILAQESKEITIEDVLREQLKQSQKDLTIKLGDVVQALDRIYDLKKPNFSSLFLINRKEIKSLIIEKDKEEKVVLVIHNNDEFPVQAGKLDICLPKGFTMRKDVQDVPTFREDYFPFYPGGAEYQSELGTIPSAFETKRLFLIKGTKLGKFKMQVWISSTTHKTYESNLNIVVK